MGIALLHDNDESGNGKWSSLRLSECCIVPQQVFFIVGALIGLAAWYAVRKPAKLSR